MLLTSYGAQLGCPQSSTQATVSTVPRLTSPASGFALLQHDVTSRVTHHLIWKTDTDSSHLIWF